jgi:two-component system, OmpR family, sensor histidine kinase BaeS
LMRSLATKLTLAFLFVGMAGAILVAVLVGRSTRLAFNRLILDQQQETLANSLEAYYLTYGTWDGVAESLRRAILEPGISRDEIRRGPFYGWDLFTLVGPDRVVIFSSQTASIGQTYTGRDLDDAVALEARGETVGWLVRAPIPFERLYETPEGSFLLRVNRAALISAITAAGLALILGSLLAFTLTRSLRELKEATEEISRGNLGMQVSIQSRDEMGELAASFNKMSQDLARATQSRRQMTADIAHDLRTPLSVISGYTEALSEGKLPGNDDVYRVMHQETQYLKRLIDDLRVLSLADAGELPLHFQEIASQASLEQAIHRHLIAAGEKGITLRLEADPDLPPVKVDPERLNQVFDNLIGNALRHTPTGGEIRLSARSAEGQVLFQVSDTGDGIDPEDLPNIFNRFYRGDPSRSGEVASGLGLAIAKSIVVAHGGRITVESIPGQGATFTISLPLFIA